MQGNNPCLTGGRRNLPTGGVTAKPLLSQQPVWSINKVEHMISAQGEGCQNAAFDGLAIGSPRTTAKLLLKPDACVLPTLLFLKEIAFCFYVEAPLKAVTLV